MRTLFVIATDDNRFATFDLRGGPYLTQSPAMAYAWKTKEEAENQLSLYSAALQIKLSIKEQEFRL